MRRNVRLGPAGRASGAGRPAAVLAVKSVQPGEET